MLKNSRKIKYTPSMFCRRFAITAGVAYIGMSWLPGCLAASAPELARKLEESGVLQKGYKCSVSLDGTVATVSTYQNLSSKNPDSDCKIDAVLLGKKIFDLRPDMTRAKVKLLDPKGTGLCRTVSITVGDIAAYSSAKTTMQSLLSSLEVLKTREPVQAPQQSKLPPSAALDSIRGVERIVQATGKMPEMVFYLERELGLRLVYPRGWTLSDQPDKDCILRFHSADGKQIIEFNYEERAEGIGLERYVQLTNDLLLHHMKGFQDLETYPLRFGYLQKFRGAMQEFRLSKDNTVFRGSLVYFFHQSKICTLRFYCPEADLEEMKALRADVLSLVDNANTQKSILARDSSKSAGVSQGQISLPASSYRVVKAGLAFKYPENWIVREHPEKDTEVSISGANKKGQYADLRFAVPDIPPEMRLEDYVQAVDSELLKAGKGMKLLDESSSSFGRANFVNGIQQAFSLDINGIPSVQLHAIFRHEGKTCWLNLTCPGWSLADAKETFSRVLSSLEER